MRTNSAPRRVSYAFLCATPFLAATLAGPRALRIPGIYQTVGIVAFAAILTAMWLLRAPRRVPDGDLSAGRMEVAGTLFLAPFALIELLWVGIGPPFQATAPENRMRYVVLLASSVAVTIAFMLVKEDLAEAGERTYSTLAVGFAMLAGAGYLVWASFQLGMFVLLLQRGAVPAGVGPVSDVFDVLLFAVGALTYTAVANLALAFERVGWLGRRAGAVYVVLNAVALAFLVLRGLSFPDPRGAAEPWYLQPGFVAGIPAIPWLMPALLGAVLLRRAGGLERMPAPAAKMAATPGERSAAGA